jgi:hypothetical protein
MNAAFRWIVLPSCGVIAIAALTYVVLRPDTASPETSAGYENRRTGDAPGLTVTTSSTDVLSLEKPDAMREPSEYSAIRLRQIKANPGEWTDALVWQREFAAADTPELQREVLGLAKQIGDEPLLALLPQALAASDYLVRLDAVRSIGWLHEQHLAEGIAIGVSAADPEMRTEAMAIAQNAPARCQREIMERTLSAPSEDVQLQSVEIISERPSQALFGLLVNHLEHSAGAVREAINSALETVTQQHFASSAEAARWWTVNANRYDDLMLPKEP